MVLLVLASLTNVVGYQTIQSSNQNAINSEVNQKELLFQTIVDIANNKEIQQVILKSQLSREGFFNPDGRFPIFKTPVLTKNELNTAYNIGLILTKIISKSKMHSMLERYQMNNQWVQKETTAVIEKNTTIKEELTQLSDLTCDCNKDTVGVTAWHFPILCAIIRAMINILSSSPLSNFLIGYILALQYDAYKLGCRYCL